MRITKVNKELFYLLINEFEKQYNREDGQTRYVIKSKVIAALKKEYIKCFAYVAGRLQNYFKTGINLVFDGSGVKITLKPLVEKEYISHTHLAERWGKFGRHLIKMFAAEPDKLNYDHISPRKLYLTERIKKIEESAAFNAYTNLLRENKRMKSLMCNI